MRIGTGIRIGRVGGRFFTQMAGSVVDMDFKTGNYVGTTPAALTATTGALKITSSGLQVVTGDLITTTNSTLLAAINSATAVIRIRAIGPVLATASTAGLLSAKAVADNVISIRLRASANQSGFTVGQAVAPAALSFITTATGVVVEAAPVVIATRHRAASVALSANGATVISGGFSRGGTIDSVRLGASETGVVWGSYIERLTIWTDDPDDATLQLRSV